MVSCYTNLSSYKTNIFYAPEHVQLPVSITQAVVQLKQFLNLNIWAFFLTSDLTWSTRKALDCVIKCHLFQANSNMPQCMRTFSEFGQQCNMHLVSTSGHFCLVPWSCKVLSPPMWAYVHSNNPLTMVSNWHLKDIFAPLFSLLLWLCLHTM